MSVGFFLIPFGSFLSVKGPAEAVNNMALQTLVSFSPDGSHMCSAYQDADCIEFYDSFRLTQRLIGPEMHIPEVKKWQEKAREGKRWMSIATHPLLTIKNIRVHAERRRGSMSGMLVMSARRWILTGVSIPSCLLTGKEIVRSVIFCLLSLSVLIMMPAIALSVSLMTEHPHLVRFNLSIE